MCGAGDACRSVDRVLVDRTRWQRRPAAERAQHAEQKRSVAVTRESFNIRIGYTFFRKNILIAVHGGLESGNPRAKQEKRQVTPHFGRNHERIPIGIPEPTIL